ncbi:transcriptional regulator [Enterococcus sp. JM4C]|uniref:helix-turn-helix transcriptional regulator n=1 Tax=Candidatus Enterococcus huntleyi TaxID=1857217 RepID=UPI00137B6552|nr:helix-turn-helix transcriptional regulator [Enterococcus sp. JM4C]KAF1295709.1 transcriptional regulator [Enterococcus sp. JM4C]
MKNSQTNPPANLQTNLKEKRMDRGLSQAELAEIVGVRRETIIRLEQGKYNPSLKLAYDLARYFQLPIESLFWYE